MVGVMRALLTVEAIIVEWHEAVLMQIKVLLHGNKSFWTASPPVSKGR